MSGRVGAVGGGIYKTGSGDLTLSGINTYTGGTRIERGRLIVSKDESLGSQKVKPGQGGTIPPLIIDQGTLFAKDTFPSSRPVTLSFFGIFNVERGKILTMNGVISGAHGALFKEGAGTLALSGTNSYEDGTTLKDGVLSVSSDGNLGEAQGRLTFDGGSLLAKGMFSSDRRVTLTGRGGFDVERGHALTMNGIISGAGILTKKGEGVLTLSGVNTYSGGTKLEGGTLSISSNENLGNVSGGLTFDSRTLLAKSGTLLAKDTFSSSRAVTLMREGVFNVEIGHTVTMNGVISGAGILTKEGEGTLALSGSNSYRDGTTLKDGVLSVSSDGNLGEAQGRLTFDGGSLLAKGMFSSDRRVTLTGRGGFDVERGHALTMNGIISGAGVLTKKGEGVLTLSGVNTYSGGTKLEGGTLSISSNENLGNVSGGLTFDSRTLLAKSGTLLAKDTFSSSRAVTLMREGVFNVEIGHTVTMNGVISGAGILTKEGEGTLALSGSNSYRDGTTLGGGVLSVSSDENLGDASGGLTFFGGTLLAKGTFSSSRAVTLMREGVFDVETGHTVTMNGVVSRASLIKEGAGTLALSGSNSYLATMLRGGVLSVSSDENLGRARGRLVFDGGSLLARGTFTSSRYVMLDTGRGVFDVERGHTVTMNGFIYGFQGVTKEGEGTLLLSSENDYIKGTILRGGVLGVSSDRNLGRARERLVFDGGSLLAKASFTSDREVLLTGAGTLREGVFDVERFLTMKGRISGDGGLQKEGKGILFLFSKLNPYKGNTVLKGGILQATKDGSLGDPDSALNFKGGTLLPSSNFTESARRVIVDSPGGSIKVRGNKSLTLSGSFNGVGTFKKEGTGSLILSRPIEYEGSFEIEEGVLQVSLNNNYAQGFENAGRLIFDQKGGDSGTVAGKISGSGSLEKKGEGTLILSGTNTYTGETKLSDGTLQVAKESNLGELSSDLRFSGGSLLVKKGFKSERSVILGDSKVGKVAVERGEDFEMAGIISGGGSLKKEGVGTLTLNKVVNLYTGGTTLSKGTLRVNLPAPGSLSQLGTGGLNLAGGTLLTETQVSFDKVLTINGASTIEVSLGSAYFDLKGSLSGAGVLNKRGSGSLVLQTDNTAYTGDINLIEGVLKVTTEDKALGSDSSYLNFQGGTLVLDKKSFSSAKRMKFENSGTIEVPRDQTATLSGKLGETGNKGDLIKKGLGKLVLTGVENKYEGQTRITEGTLEPKEDRSLGATTGLILDEGGTLALPSGFASARPVTFDLLGVVDVKQGTATLSGTLKGEGGLSKKGKGTLKLTKETNEYKGETHITEGTLSPSADGSLGDPKASLIFDGGGVLALQSGFTSEKRKMIFDGSGVINVLGGTATLSGIFGGKGKFTKMGPGILVLSNQNQYVEGFTEIVEGTLVIGAQNAIGNIKNLGALVLKEVGKGIYRVVVSGGGTVTKEGTGELVLSEKNFYTGKTTVETGTLTLAENGNLGDSDLEVKDRASLLISTDSKTIPVKSLSGEGAIHIQDGNILEVQEGDFSGPISSSPTSLDSIKGVGQEVGGSLNKVSSGTLILSGINTYTGRTAVKEGKLKLEGDLSPSSDLYVLKGGEFELVTNLLRVSQINGAGIIKLKGHTLEVNGGNFSGKIEGGAGSTLRQVDRQGTLILSGKNTFESLSFQGTLKFFSDENLGNSGVLELNGGTLSPLKTATLSKDLHVSASSVIDVGHAFSDRLRLTLSGELTGGKEGDTKFDLQKEGLGKLEIGSATNRFEGRLLVKRGTLVIPKGKKLTKATVRLTGGASVLIGASDEVIEKSLGSLEHTYGTVRIGQEGSSQTGTFKVGTYTMGASGTLHIRLKPSFGKARIIEREADVLEAETANLNENGGSLFLDLSSGFYEPGAIYTLLKAKTLNAENLDGIKILEKHPLHFELIKQPLPSGLQGLQIRVLFSEVVLPVDLDHLKGDAREIAENLFSSPSNPSTELKQILEPIIKSTPEEFIKDLLLLGPQKFGRGITLLNAQSNINVAREMNRSQALDGWNPLASRSRDSGQSLWVTPIAFTIKQREIESLYPFNSEGYGFVAGYSHLLNSLAFSIGTGYTDSKLNWREDLGNAHIQAAYIAPSFGYHGKYGNFGLVLSCASRFYDVDRKMRFQESGALVRKRAHNQHKGYDMLAGLVGAFRIKFPDSFQKNLFIMPTVRFDYVNMIEFGYQEKGAGPINLFVKRMRASFFRSEFSLKFLKQIDWNFVRVCPTLFVGWVFDAPLKKGRYIASFEEELSKEDFIVQGYHESTDQINLGAELLIMRSGSSSLKLSYRANLGGSFWTQEGLLNLNFAF